MNSDEEHQHVRRAVIGARRRAGLTQRQLAERAGIAQSAVARLESGQHLPGIGTLQKLARALQVPIVITPTSFNLPAPDPRIPEVARSTDLAIAERHAAYGLLGNQPPEALDFGDSEEPVARSSSVETARVTEDGELIIPAGVCRQAGLAPGAPVELRAGRNSLAIRPLRTEVEVVERDGWLVAVFRGPGPTFTDEDVERTREALLDERGIGA